MTDLGGVAKIMREPYARALFALIAIILIGALFNADGAFFKWGTHRDMLRQASVFGILACGMTVVIISAGIDLAVGSVLALIAVVFSILTIHGGVPPLIAIPCCLALGAAFGSVSGGLIARFKIQPFIATLAMMVFARGLAKYVSGGKKVSTVMQDADGNFVNTDLPAVFTAIDSRVLGGNLSVVTIIFLVCLLVSWLVLERLRPGRYVFAIGGSEEASRLSGVPVARTKVLAYGLSGLFAAVAGICQAAQEYQGDPEAGMGYELSAIAIVVIGGTNLMGGRGSVVLTLLGTLTIGYLEKILSINAVGEASRLMLTGVIIVSAVLLQRQRE
jgi:ribose transport system permease protein